MFGLVLNAGCFLSARLWLSFSLASPDLLWFDTGSGRFDRSVDASLFANGS